MRVERHNVNTLLDNLRWRADQIITNYDGVRVWLKRTAGGVTDCCEVEYPCDFHSKLTHPAPTKNQ